MMRSFVEPFIHFTHESLEAYLRFARSSELVDIAQYSFAKHVEYVEEVTGRMLQSDAFAEWCRAMLDNYVRFLMDYSDSVYAIALRGTAFWNHPGQEGGRRLESVGDAAGRIAGARAEAMKSASRAGAEVANQTEGVGQEAQVERRGANRPFQRATPNQR